MKKSLLVLTLVAACRGGLELPDTVTIQEKSFTGSNEPRYVFDGGGASVSIYASGSNVSQAYYATKNGNTKVRVLYDDLSQQPTAIIDDVTGDYVVISERADGAFEYLQYDKNNSYKSGYALVADGGSWKLGKVIGHPVLTGQIQGQLLVGGVNEGGFAVIGDPASSVSEPDDVTEQMDALITASDPQSAPLRVIPAPVSLSQVATFGGVVLVGLAVGGALAPAYGAAGVAMIASGLFANDLASAIQNNFMSEDPFAQEMIDTAVRNIGNPSGFGPLSVLNRIIDRAKEFASGSPSPSTPDTTYEPVEDYSSPPPAPLSPSSYPAPTSGPPPIATNVSGQAVWKDNTVTQVTGTVNTSGQLTLNNVGGNTTVQVNGTVINTTVTGTYNRGTQTGTMMGNVTNVSACAAATNSGGQGTFTAAHFVGTGNGTVSFSYDAYSIPDAFTVTISGATKYTTGGLVAGAGIASIPINGEQFVFVSVSAPQDGTSWEYTLGCL